MRVALGVSGGVAAYKAAELVRKLQQEGIDVQVVMTRAARRFVGPSTFAALTGKSTPMTMTVTPAWLFGIRAATRLFCSRCWSRI